MTECWLNYSFCWKVHIMRDKHTPGLTREDISVIYAERETPSPGSHFGPIIRNVYILECCISGYGSVTINGTEFPIGPGSCYILLPGDTVIHKADTENPREGYWCALDGISIEKHVENAGISSQNPFIAPELFEPICHIMEQLTQLWVCRDAGAQLRQTACAYGILGIMLQNKPATEKTSLIDMAVGLMQTHYPDPITVSGLADQVGLERTYFSDLFKQKTGHSPYQYLTKLRIQKACQLMQEHSISDTAYLVGMEPHNFGRVFKKEIGCSPREYMQKLKKHKTKHVIRPIEI